MCTVPMGKKPSQESSRLALRYSLATLSGNQKGLSDFLDHLLVGDRLQK